MTRPLKAAAMDGLRQPVLRNRTGAVKIGDGIRTKSTLFCSKASSHLLLKTALQRLPHLRNKDGGDPVFGLPNVAIH